MKLRSHEEIQAHLTTPKNLEVLRKAAMARSTVLSEPVKLKRERALASLMFKAACGEKIFRSKGRAFKAVADFREHYKISPEKARVIGAQLQVVAKHVNHSVWSLDPDKLVGFSPVEKDIAIHKMKGIVAYWVGSGKYLSIRNRFD